MSDISKAKVKAVSVANAISQKGLLMATTPSTVRARLKRWKVSTDAGASGDSAVLFQLMHASTAGTASAQTAVKNDPAAPTPLVTYTDTFTVNPTYTDEIDYVRLPTAGGGAYEYTWPLGDEPVLAVSDRAIICVTTGGQTRLNDAEMEVHE